MALADHVFVRRLGGLYAHHGIDCGDGSVIHYTGDTPLASKVQRTSGEAFGRGGRIEIRPYDAFEEVLRARSNRGERASQRWNELLDRLKGLPEADEERTPEAVIGRAESRLGEANFDFALNNCEHFATWCKTGLSGSPQIDAIWRAILSPPRYWNYQVSGHMTTWFQALGWNR